MKTATIQRSGAGDDVERDGNQLRSAKTRLRDQDEIRQERAGRRAGRVDGVEHGNLPAARALDVGADAVTNQQRQRAAHQHRDRSEQTDRDRSCATYDRADRTNQPELSTTYDDESAASA